MNWYKVKLKLKSWVASSWQADTIFGHLCWGMRYLYGTDTLTTFLQAYEEENPPLLLSNGFPGELMPLPLLASHIIDKNLSKQEQENQFQRYKQARGIKYVTQDEFTRALSGEEVIPSSVNKYHPVTRITLKNQINRLTCTTGEEGSLYNFEEYYWPEVTIYTRIRDDFTDVARSLFKYIADTGYGKRKSTGYGHIDSFILDPFAGFATITIPNGFVTLSNFVPARNDPVNGAWQSIIKYGKMGEEYASEDHVFKKPLLMIEAGSTFYDSPCKDYYGRLIKGISHYSESVQYGFALPVPITMPAMPE